MNVTEDFLFNITLYPLQDNNIVYFNGQERVSVTFFPKMTYANKEQCTLIKEKAGKAKQFPSIPLVTPFI